MPPIKVYNCFFVDIDVSYLTKYCLNSTVFFYYIVAWTTMDNNQQAAIF